MNEEKNNVVEIENNKISVADYINEPTLLKLQYMPFDSKLQIIGHVFTGMINAVGGLNTTLLRRLSVEAFIDAVTNIDMNIRDNNGLDGFDQLCYHNELGGLIELMGNEYIEFKKMLDERTADYIRIETNPSVTINQIYDQFKEALDFVLNYVSERVQNIDTEKLGEQLRPFIEKAGDLIESK